MWSFWEQETFIGKPDLVVIGSGIVGLSAAINYQSEYPKHNVLVLESGHLPSGASTKNAGFACFGSPSELLMDLKDHTTDEVAELVEKRILGLKTLKSLLGSSNIDFETPGSYELFKPDDKEQLDKVKSKLDDLNSLITPLLRKTPYQVNKTIITQSGFKNFSEAIQIHGEGQIHTGKMMYHLIQLAKSKGVQILNGIKSEEIENQNDQIIIYTDQGKIIANQCIIATNGFAQRLIPELNIEPARAQVLITQPINDLKFKGTFHFDEGYFYFRNVGNRVLFGGGRNLDFSTEKTDDLTLNDQIQEHLTQLLSSHILPSTHHVIAQQWTGIMGLGQSKSVLCKRLSTNIYVAARLGGMGIAIGSLIGKEVVDLIKNDQ